MLDDRNILLVEDEALLALDLSMTLEDEGAAVTGPFATVETALSAVSGRIDAAVLDVDIVSGMSFPIADRLRRAGIPFVFHTGRSDLDSLRRRYGRDVPILEKPARHGSLLHALKTVLPVA